MRGVPLKVVQELLCHQTIQMTLRRNHQTPAVRRGPIELLEGEPKLEGKLEPEVQPEPDRVPKSGPGARPNNGQTVNAVFGQQVQYAVIIGLLDGGAGSRTRVRK